MALKEIRQPSELLKIGSTINIDLSKVQDRLPEKLLYKLNLDPSGQVVDYKITDGTEIGCFLQLSDGTIHWFFTKEVKESNPDSIISNKGRKAKRQKAFTGRYAMQIEKKSISFVINPFNFGTWIINSTKDII